MAQTSLHGLNHCVKVFLGWVGFGIPSEAGGMIGASAIIVKACPTCPTGKYPEDATVMRVRYFLHAQLLTVLLHDSI